MPTDDDVIATLDRMQPNGRAVRVTDLAKELGVDADDLEAHLETMSRIGSVWQVSWWWVDDQDSAREFAYFTRRGDPNDDITGRDRRAIG